MSTTIPPPLQGSQVASGEASTSTNPETITPASYHPLPRPIPMPPFERVDIHVIKQELHDALGEHGLPYWKALNGYLVGQIGRAELANMVKGWLKGDKIQLHNRLLISLLHNASTPPASLLSPNTVAGRKRRRADPDDLEFDIDPIKIEPRSRVHRWVLGLSHRDRNKIRRMVMGKEGEEKNMEDELEAEANRKKWAPSFLQPDTVMPPLSSTERQLPSSLQLSHRLAQLSKVYNLSLSAEASNEIGEFLAVGLDAHLGDIFHGIAHLTSKGRPGFDSLRIPLGVKHESNSLPNGISNHQNIKVESEEDLPTPDLHTLQTLWTMNPSLHPSASSSVYKLGTSHSIAESEHGKPVKKERKPSVSIGSPGGTGKLVSASGRAEDVTKSLSESGLLKLDKGRESQAAEEGGGGKKDKKHGYHWKYEDPAIILKDMLG